MNITEFKSHFYQGNDFVHLNNSGQGLIPDVYRDSLKKWSDRFYSEGAHCAPEGWNITEVTRSKLAKFIGAERVEVSFFPTTSSAISQAAFGVPLLKDDEVLTWDQEYPSNFYPWREACDKNGAKLIQVSSDNMQTPAEKILSKVTTKTKAIAISWVQYQTGSVTDLEMLSKELKGKNIWLVADIIQGVGVKPFDFHKCGFDIVCSGSHKFMCAGYGAGFMAVKKDRLHEIAPLEYGAITFGTPDTEKSFSIKPKSDSIKFEPGSKNMMEVIALGETLDLFEKVGIEAIYNEASRLGKKLTKGLQDLSIPINSEEGHIINFSDLKNRDQIAEKFLKTKLSFAKRAAGIRLSFHAYNSDGDVEKVLSLLSEK